MNQPAPANRTLELRGLLQRLRCLTRELRPRPDEEPMALEEVVGVGRELWRLIDTAQKALEVVKTRARLEVDSTPGRHEIDGPDGALCVVVVPEAAPQVRRGVSVGELEQLVGTGRFGELFTVKTMVRPRQDFTERVPELPPEVAANVLGMVDMQTGRPRVSFSKRNGQ